MAKKSNAEVIELLKITHANEVISLVLSCYYNEMPKEDFILVCGKIWDQFLSERSTDDKNPKK